MKTTIKKAFQLTAFTVNENKRWSIEATPDAHGCYTLKISWGRVGSAEQSRVRPSVSLTYVEARVQEKLRKGYVELDLHEPVAQAPPVHAAALVRSGSVDPKVENLVANIFAAAGDSVGSYLKVRVDALSAAQLAKARVQLQVIADATTKRRRNDAEVQALVMDYFNLVPTKLPRNLRDQAVVDGVIHDFCANLHEQEQRLDQLDSALATYQAPEGTTVSAYERLGCNVTHMAPHDAMRQKIADFIATTSRHGYMIKIHDVYELLIPSERAAFARDERGKGLVLRLTHGSAAGNFRHILHEKGEGSGLRLPRNQANGWAFGPGIYFASVASKSAQYSWAYKGASWMLLCDVAVGRMHTPKQSVSLKEAPPGFDSTWARAGQTSYLAHDEFIVYRQPQQTARYLVEFSGR